MDFFRRSNFDIIGRSKLWFTVSLVVIVVGMASMVTKGMNYGIDFTGGSLLKYQFERSLVGEGSSEPQIIVQTRSVLQQYGLGSSQVQVSGDDQLFIRTGTLDEKQAAEQDEQVSAALEKQFGERSGKLTRLGRDLVGPVVGERLRNTALLALILGAILILIYIAVRYEFRFGVAGVVALIHDVLIVVGVMSLLRAELNSEFVAAILTVIGYSVNDSVVIFDRIRENMRLYRGTRFADIVNTSLLQTLTRSINTTVTTLFALIALFFFGGPAIHSFALALIIGIACGAYSSIFIASPIVVAWERGQVTVEKRRRPAYVGAIAKEGGGAPAPTTQKESEPEKVSSKEAIQQAREVAQEEKREERRERRKRRGDKSSRRRF
ncbi:MAG: protein translocase subunit SecF [Candidatus Bathyarchaeota archaeon]